MSRVPFHVPTMNPTADEAKPMESTVVMLDGATIYRVQSFQLLTAVTVTLHHDAKSWKFESGALPMQRGSSLYVAENGLSLVHKVGIDDSNTVVYWDKPAQTVVLSIASNGPIETDWPRVEFPQKKFKRPIRRKGAEWDF